jgi:hypothetical protein
MVELRATGKERPVTFNDAPLLDTRDMFGVHQALNGGLTTAIDVIPARSDGDRARTEQLSSFIAEVLWLLHAHHSGEDELLYPLLIERVPDSQALFSTMDDQHLAVAQCAERAGRANERFGTSALSGDGGALVAALTELRAVAADHLTEEEVKILPIAARYITPPEWGALPGHALGSYRGDRMWLPLGLVFEAMPDDIRASMLERMPPPVVGMWTGGGSDAFVAEMQAIRA